MITKLSTSTAIGLSLLAIAAYAQPNLSFQTLKPIHTNQIILAQAASTDGSSFALNPQLPNTITADATAQIDAYIALVSSSYEKSTASAKLLETSVEKFLADPTAESLSAARVAWVQARPDYLKTEAFRFYGSPIDDVEGKINAWPMNEAFIDYVEGKPDSGLINSKTVEITAASIIALNQQQDDADVSLGWHAVEFLLWGQDLSTTGPGNRPHTDYIAAQGNNDRRRAYLSVSTKMLVEELQGLAPQWNPATPESYASNLKKIPQVEAIGRIMAGIAFLISHEFKADRLAVALDSGDQEDEHSCFSDTTKQDFVYDLVGVRQVWTGDDGITKRLGLRSLFGGEHEALGAKLDAAIAKTEANVAALGDPWDQVLATPAGSPEKLAGEEVVKNLEEVGNIMIEVGNTLGVKVLVAK